MGIFDTDREGRQRTGSPGALDAGTASAGGGGIELTLSPAWGRVLVRGMQQSAAPGAPVVTLVTLAPGAGRVNVNGPAATLGLTVDIETEEYTVTPTVGAVRLRGVRVANTGSVVSLVPAIGRIAWYGLSVNAAARRWQKITRVVTSWG